jgi:uncharacterized protein
MHSAILDKRNTLAEVCRRFHVRRLEVFGSAARGDDFDAARSDADFLVEFEAAAVPDLTALLDMQEALRQALGREADLLERRTVERSRNYLRRRQILGEAEPVYVA